MPKLTKQQAKKMRLKRAMEEAAHRVAHPFSINVGAAVPSTQRGTTQDGIPWVRKPKSRISLVDVGPINGNA